MTTKQIEQPEEQLRYAAWLDRGTRLGLMALVVFFVLYASGLVSPHLPHARLAQVWSLPVDQFLAATQLPSGWGWIHFAHRSDIANLVGISILAGCSMLCLLIITPMVWRRGDRLFATLCVAEFAVLLLAASGVLTAGH